MRLALAAGVGLFLAAAILFAATGVPPSPRRIEFQPLPDPEGRAVLVLGRGTGRIVGAAQDMVPFAKYLEDRLPVRCRLRVVPDPFEYQREIERGEIDLMHMGPFEYVAARARGSVVAIASPREERGVRFYRGIVVTANPAVRRLADLVRRRVTYVDDQSASGYLFPVALLYENRIDPDRDFTVFEPSGSHENVILHLLSGRYDAGFVLEGQRERVLSASEIGRVRVIAHTAWIPLGVLAISDSLARRNPILAERIRALVAETDRDSEGARAYASLFRGASGYAPPRDADFDPVRRVAKILTAHGRTPR